MAEVEILGHNKPDAGERLTPYLLRTAIPQEAVLSRLTAICGPKLRKPTFAYGSAPSSQ